MGAAVEERAIESSPVARQDYQRSDQLEQWLAEIERPD
jgi:hypothetical protein